MPTYIWRCNADASTIEMYQQFTDDSIPDCPVCQKAMSKVIHATPTHFRGGGWGGK